jgi:hypothetical protein
MRDGARLNELLDHQRVLREATTSLLDQAAETRHHSTELLARCHSLTAEARLLQDDFAYLRRAYLGPLASANAGRGGRDAPHD